MCSVVIEGPAVGDKVVSGEGEPGEALWRWVLSGEAKAPHMRLTADLNLMHPGGSDAFARGELSVKHLNEVNHQVGWWAVETLGHDDPEARRIAAEALEAVIAYEDDEPARRWVIYEAGMFGFLCACSPKGRIRAMSYRYNENVRRIQQELAAG